MRHERGSVCGSFAEHVSLFCRGPFALQLASRLHSLFYTSITASPTSNLNLLAWNTVRFAKPQSSSKPFASVYQPKIHCYLVLGWTQVVLGADFKSVDAEMRSSSILPFQRYSRKDALLSSLLPDPWIFLCFTLLSETLHLKVFFLTAQSISNVLDSFWISPFPPSGRYCRIDSKQTPYFTTRHLFDLSLSLHDQRTNRRDSHKNAHSLTTNESW